MKNPPDESRYNYQTYNTPDRLASYFYQFKELSSHTGEGGLIINIGIGSDFLNWYIKTYAAAPYKILGVDINPVLKPRIASSVMALGLRDGIADCVLCCQVLEHMAFLGFETALREIRRIVKDTGTVILSLPDSSFYIQASLKLPKMRFKGTLPLSFIKARQHPDDKKHFWEINKAGYSLKKVKDILNRFFEIEKDYRPFENPYHHFFVLKPRAGF